MTGSEVHVSVNSFDLIILSIFALSTIIAFFRGFIRELLSFGAWVGAAAITIYLFPHSEQMMHGYMKKDTLAAASAALITYFFALIFISIINSIILRYVKDADVGLLDNFLGMMFGALRGAFVVSFGFLILMAIVPRSPQPDWLKTSITKNYLKVGADTLVDIAPKYMVEMEAAVKKQVDHETNPQNYEPTDKSGDYHPPQTQGVSNSIR